MMKKIAVIGCGGSGKSTLARELGQLLSIPVHHLDKIFWKPNWKPMQRAEFLEAQKAIFATDSWIMDGNYGGTMKPRLSEADTIIFCDLPTLSCLRGAIGRYFKYRNRTRPEMSEGNNERLDMDFLLWILFYRRTRRPAIISMLHEFEQRKEVVNLSSRHAIRKFIEQIKNKQSEQLNSQTKY
jgi:adenylate kinase family enzyme